MDTFSKSFADEMEDFLSRTGMKPTRFGRVIANGDRGFVKYIRDGGSTTLHRADELRAAMRAHLKALEAEQAAA